ncbi:SDR family NAD(P)-dependent oxidoreductase [Mucilaginibacter sp. SJ]|uniref:SDR family NAD(P)-dependent oxidoreductase n=1 Tax=Mucilaginibacter sp. SJ TaxID=3029053 RepID=UPI0023AA13DF|nr:SDR family oxidoreductase [Mucilaginibacter sp. SJ]WEA00025.1 SDR family oxidoreductase [Mucilaginibacter sp. SJ]
MMDQYALVTGAGKGIGRSMAILLAQKGYNLLLVSRSENDLIAVSAQIMANFHVKTDYLEIDLSGGGAALRIFDWAKNLNVPVSILINNAGHGAWGNFDELDLAAQTRMMQVNMNAPAEISYHFIPLLKLQQQAFILNVASTAAYQAVPTLAVYAATKAFVLSFSRALRYELKDTPVSVSCLCPGPTDTGFANAAGMDALAELAAKFNMKPEEVAVIGIKGMFDKKAEIIPGFLNKLSAVAATHAPKSLIERVTAGLYKR